MYVNSGEAAHGSLNGFGTVDVGCGERTEDVAYAKPVGYADDGSEVAGVLHIVEHQTEFAGCHLCERCGIVLLTEHCEDGLGSLLCTDALEFVVGDGIGVGREERGEMAVLIEPLGCGCKVGCREVGQEVGDEFAPLGYKDVIERSLFLLRERTDVFYLVF